MCVGGLTRQPKQVSSLAEVRCAGMLVMALHKGRFHGETMYAFPLTLRCCDPFILRNESCGQTSRPCEPESVKACRKDEEVELSVCG